MTTHFVFGVAGEASGGWGAIPVLRNDSAVSETIASSGSNQQTTATAPAVGTTPVCLVSTDTAVYVAFGTNPNASTGTSRRFFMPANSMMGFVVARGDKAAVVNA